MADLHDRSSPAAVRHTEVPHETVLETAASEVVFELPLDNLGQGRPSGGHLLDKRGVILLYQAC